MKKIILIGSGGHSRSCIEVIESEKKFKISLLVDKVSENKGRFNTILESNFISNYKLDKTNLLISIGQLKSGKQRKKIYEFYKNKGCNFPVIQSKSSYISNKSKINEGTIIMHRAFVNSNSIIGKNCIINTGVIIEHDVVIGNNVHIAPGAIILGGCHIKENSFIGSGVVLKQNTLLKKDSIISSSKYFK